MHVTVRLFIAKIFLFSAAFGILGQPFTEECKPRNRSAALAVGRPCRKLCYFRNDKRCKQGKVCMCDHECGFSCINLNNTCLRPNAIPFMRAIRVLRTAGSGSQIAVRHPPYKYNDLFKYQCMPGYKMNRSALRYCHGRRGWTNGGGLSTCVRSCPERNIHKANRYLLACGRQCQTDSDCSEARGTRCMCDSACGRSCVNPDVNCGIAFPIANGVIEYTGKGINRVAHYVCNEGFYLRSGNPSRKCTGGGTYDGIPPACRRVECGDPLYSIMSTGGRRGGLYGPFYVGAQLTFTCPSTHRLLGDSRRTCLSNGQWSRTLAACDDLSGNLTRCPHPGVPVNGRLLTIGRNFSVGAVVEFQCDRGYLMEGDAQQECLYFLQWSDGGAPICSDASYADQHLSGMEIILDSIEDLQEARPAAVQTVRRVTGRRIIERYELYLLVDVSQMFDEGVSLIDESVDLLISFLKQISKDDKDYYHIAILAYGNQVKVVRRISEAPINTNQAIQLLLEIASDKENLRLELGEQSDLSKALTEFQNMASKMLEKKTNSSRKILVTINGRTVSRIDVQRSIQNMIKVFKDNLPEISVFVSCSDCKQTVDQISRDLFRLATSSRHIILNRDSYRSAQLLQRSLDSKRDLKLLPNFLSCGKAGNTQSVKKSVRNIGRVVAGDTVKAGTWPWQVAISMKGKPNELYANTKAGGSLLSSSWILTAAHVFDKHSSEMDWFKNYVVVMGSHKLRLGLDDFFRPHSSVKVFEPTSIFIHEKYVPSSDYDYDIALIKLGREQVVYGSSFVHGGSAETVNFTTRIRPVCLPCVKNDCFQVDSGCKSAGLIGKTTDLYVVTGFGHSQPLAPRSGKPLTTDHLQQGIVQIKHELRCSSTAAEISNITSSNLKYTERMICALGEFGGKVVDACQGDSGGPLVKEVYNETTKQSTWVQVGVVSWGYGCAYKRKNELAFPGFYTNVLTLLPWIKSKIEQPNCSCPGDPSELENGRTCQVSCATDRDCPAVTQQCLCDDDCGMTCIDPNVECAAAPLLANGRVSGGVERYGQTLTYSCDPGFVLEGNGSRTCRSDGKWSGITPVCRGTCRLPSIPANLHVRPNKATYREGEDLTFSCLNGTTLIGGQTATCELNRTWSEVFPTCQAKCRVPNAPQNGRVSPPSGSKVSLNARVEFRCDRGYGISGQSLATCGRSGSLSSSVPLCKAIFCRVPIAPRHSSITPPSGMVGYRGTLRIKCLKGYVTVGSSSLTCVAQGQWSASFPACRAVKMCGDPPIVLNAKTQGRLRTFGATVVYTCLPGFVLSGSGRRTCLPDRTWSGKSPSCHVACSVPRAKDNALPMARKRIFAANETLKFVCRTGFRSMGNAEVTCKVDGTWSNLPRNFSCNQVLCEPPQDRINTRMIGSNFSVGRQVRFECLRGFQKIGRTGILTCDGNGKWSGRFTTCRRVCYKPDINDGIQLQPVRATYFVGNAVTFSCVKGELRLFGSSSGICQQNGTWSHQSPICGVGCRIPDLSSMSYSLPKDDRGKYFFANGYWPHGTTVNYHCIRNHVMFGSNSSTCQESGTWTSPAPVCKKICDFPVRPKTLVKQPDKKAYVRGDSVLFSCKNGAHLLGATRLTCGWLGTWSGPVPTCTAHPTVCRIPRRQNFQSQPNKNTFLSGETVQFSCMNGFILLGLLNSTCKDGLWSNPIPYCRTGVCNIPANGDNIEMQPVRVVYATGNAVQFSCVQNELRLFGASSAICQKNGSWSHPSPNCGVGCRIPDLSNMWYGLPKEDRGKYFFANGYWPHGTTVNYHCIQKHVMFGSNSSTCQESGRWTSPAPVCKRVCDFPSRPNTLEKHPSKTTYVQGDVVSFFCKSGSNLVGERNSTCNRFGVWNRPVPTCTATPKVRCRISEHPPSRLFVQPPKKTFDVGESVTFSCRRGFRLVGSRSSTCQRAGVWLKRIPSCKRICKVQRNDPNIVIVPKKASYLAGTVVAFSCKPGFKRVGSQTSRCQPNGRWQNPNPRCIVDVKCRIPDRKLNSLNRKPNKITFKVGETVQFSCQRGFQLVGNGNSSCQENGIWLKHLPTCQVERTQAHTTTYQATTTTLPAITTFSTALSCGGFIQAKTSRFEAIMSPGFPNRYPNSAKCTWTVIGRPGHMIRFSANSIKTESCCDSITFSAGGEQLHTISGTMENTVLDFDQGILTITFESDGNVQHKGFYATVSLNSNPMTSQAAPVTTITTTPTSTLSTVLSSVCGLPTISLIVGFNRTLTSPGWPNNYYSNLDCTWTIFGEVGYSIGIRFTTFRTENCCDRLHIYDGNALLESFSGSHDGKAVKLDKTQISIRFKSDRNFQRQGFLAKIYLVPNFSEPVAVVTTQAAKTTSTFSTTTIFSGRRAVEIVSQIRYCSHKLPVPRKGETALFSPNHPLNYGNGLRCSWVITGQSSSSVHLWFAFVDTEECCDIITIRDGSSSSAPVMGTLSGQLFKFVMYRSTGNVIRVEFVTDSTVIKKGFGAYYGKEEIPFTPYRTCNETYSVFPKIRYFASPGFPTTPYPNALSCLWNFISKPGTRIKFTFVGLIIFFDEDFVTVYDKSGTRIQQIAEFRGWYFEPKIVISTGNEAMVALTTDATFAAGGFRASYQTI